MDVRKCDIRVVSKPLYGARYAANRGLALYFWHSEDMEKSNIAPLNASTMNILTPTFKKGTSKSTSFKCVKLMKIHPSNDLMYNVWASKA